MTLSMTVEGIPAEEAEELCLAIGETLNAQPAIAASYNSPPPPPTAVIESDRTAPPAEDKTAEPAQQTEVRRVARKPRIVVPGRLPPVGSDLKIEVLRPLDEDEGHDSPLGSDAHSVIEQVFKDVHPALSLHDIRDFFTPSITESFARAVNVQIPIVVQVFLATQAGVIAAEALKTATSEFTKKVIAWLEARVLKKKIDEVRIVGPDGEVILRVTNPHSDIQNLKRYAELLDKLEQLKTLIPNLSQEDTAGIDDLLNTLAQRPTAHLPKQPPKAPLAKLNSAESLGARKRSRSHRRSV